MQTIEDQMLLEEKLRRAKDLQAQIAQGQASATPTPMPVSGNLDQSRQMANIAQRERGITAYEQPYLHANNLEGEAAPRNTAPDSVKQMLIQGFLGAVHPGGYAGYRAGVEGQERQRQQDVLARVKDLRDEGFQQQQAYRQNQNAQLGREHENAALALQRQNFASEDAYRQAQIKKLQSDKYASGALGIYNTETGEVTTSATPQQPNTPFALWRSQNPNGTVEQWQALQPKPAGPQADYEWVTRNGKPVQIRKGTAQAGDQPYDAVASRQKELGSGDSPYSKERALRTIQSIEELLPQVNNMTVGAGSLLSGVPMTSALSFKGQLDTLKSAIITNELSQMRNSSRTGGALGQVSDRESTYLAAALGNLDQAQSPNDMKTQLNKVRASIERWQQAMEQYGTNSQEAPSPSGGEPTRTRIKF